MLKKNLPLKELYIDGSGLLTPLAFFVGYCFGEGRIATGVIWLGIYILIDNLASRLFLKIMGK